MPECQCSEPLVFCLKDFSLFLKKSEEKNQTYLKDWQNMGIFFNSCNFETRGSLYNYHISIHCPPTSGKLDSQLHHHFPGVRTTGVNSRIQRPNWTADARREIAHSHTTWGKSYNPIPSMYIFTYIWLIFMVNVGKDTIHGWYGQQNSESTKVVARFHIYIVLSQSLEKKNFAH